MIAKFDIEAEYDSKNTFPWADKIAREFLGKLNGIISTQGYRIITRDDDGNGGTRETITTEAEFTELKKVYYCDFQFENAGGLKSMWFRLSFSSSKAQCGVINLLTITKVTNKDFRGLTIKSQGRTDFLSYYLVKRQPPEEYKPPAPKKERADIKLTTIYHFKVLANPDLIAVWCAVDENPAKPDKGGFFRAYANVLSCIKLANTTLNVPEVLMCNGLMTGILKACEIYTPSVSGAQRSNKVQTGRILLAAAYPDLYEWINRCCILIPNFKEYDAQDFEITCTTPFHIFCEDRYISFDKIASYGYLDSISGTKKQLVAFIEDWSDI